MIIGHTMSHDFNNNNKSLNFECVFECRAHIQIHKINESLSRR